MTSVTAVVGALLLASSVLAALWLLRREVLRGRARTRLHEDEGEDERREASSPSPISGAGRARRLTREPPLWWAGAVGGIVFAAAAAFWDSFLAAGVGMVVAALAHVSFSALAKRRALLLEEGLAEAIALSSSALRAGASPVDALERAARAVRGPARAILLDLAGSLRLGEDVDRALETLVARVPLESYRLFAIALAVQWRAGGSLERSLAVVARAVRDRVELERRIYSQAAPTRVSVFAFVLATAAIAYMMWQNDPVNLEHFLASSTGINLVGSAIWLQAIGILWMWNMSRIRV